MLPMLRDLAGSCLSASNPMRSGFEGLGALRFEGGLSQDFLHGHIRSEPNEASYTELLQETCQCCKVTVRLRSVGRLGLVAGRTAYTRSRICAGWIADKAEVVLRYGSCVSRKATSITGTPQQGTSDLCS